MGNEVAIADRTDRFALTGSRIQGNRLGVECVGCFEDVADRQRRCTTILGWVARKLLIEEVLHGLLRFGGQESVVLNKREGEPMNTVNARESITIGSD